jgi:hypothetical protein
LCVGCGEVLVERFCNDAKLDIQDILMSNMIFLFFHNNETFLDQTGSYTLYAVL